MGSHAKHPPSNHPSIAMAFEVSDYIGPQRVSPGDLPSLERDGKIWAQPLYREIVMVSFRSYGSDLINEEGIRPAFTDMTHVTSAIVADVIGSLNGNKVSLFDLCSANGRKIRATCIFRYEMLHGALKRMNGRERLVYEVAPMLTRGIMGAYLGIRKDGGRGLIVRFLRPSRTSICIGE